MRSRVGTSPPSTRQFRPTGAAWIAEYFSPQYPAEVSDEEVVHDILRCPKRPVSLSVAECEQCGRLWVRWEPEGNSYRSYAPDEPGYAGVLRSSASSEAE
jgi:hypothetical protein